MSSKRRPSPRQKSERDGVAGNGGSSSPSHRRRFAATVVAIGTCLATLTRLPPTNAPFALPVAEAFFSSEPPRRESKRILHTPIIPSTRSTLSSSLMFDMDGATQLSTGSVSFPPMVSVPCRSPCADDDAPPVLREMVKPPNVEALYEWYCTHPRTPDADPSWAVLWPTAVSLAEYLLRSDPRLVQHQQVVELGAGLGLCGLVAGALGARCVTLTDREPYALHCALATAACNDLSQTVHGAILEWSNPVLPHGAGSNSGSSSSQCDVVLASDVLYDGDTIAAFANACQKLLEQGGLLLVADPKEERFPTARATLREALESLAQQQDRKIDMEIVDLPPIDSCDADAANPATTMDGRDHQERMKEATVLIRCTFEKRDRK